MASRLRKVPGIHLVAEKDGQQIGFQHFGKHFSGHMDGVINGLVESPNKWHVWEHKSVKLEKFNQLAKLRIEVGEKNALEKWDEVYYAQAQIYMHFSTLDRHFLTVSSPGGRDYISIRTEFKESVAESLLKKAHRIIFSTTIPAKLSEKAEHYKCRLCDYSEICHNSKPVQKSCGTCDNFRVHESSFYCALTEVSMENQSPCGEWRQNKIFGEPAKAGKESNVQEKEQKSNIYAWQK